VADQLLGILLPAFLAGLLVLATHVPLGRLVLERGIVFIDLAIAQVAGLGVVAAGAIGLEPSGWHVQASAALAALAAAGFLVWTERRFAEVQEALIGVLFVLAASLQILLLSFDPHGAEHLKELLVGQILWVSPGDLVPVAVLYAGVLAAFCFFDLRRRRLLFYGVFALTITASVQLIGVYLVFASLIIPALAGELVRGYAVGFVGYVLGLVASALLDVPTGAAIVCALAAAGTASFAVRQAVAVTSRRSPAVPRRSPQVR
jgi:zinc/manganese transport system permease protein